jgi:hypothetical protein
MKHVEGNDGLVSCDATVDDATRNAPHFARLERPHFVADGER